MPARPGSRILQPCTRISNPAVPSNIDSAALCCYTPQMPGVSYKKTNGNGNGNGGLAELMRELWNTAVNLRGNIEPADYKRYVLPLIFLWFLSMRFEKRHAELLTQIDDPGSDLHTKDQQLALDILNDSD